MKKHILMLLEHPFPEDERVEKEALSLLKNGYKVSIVCCSLKEKDYKRSTYKSIDIFTFPMSKFIYKSSIGILNIPFYFRFWHKITLLVIRKIKPDYIHVHDLPLAKVGKRLAEKYRLKFVLDLHENWPALLNISTHTQTFLGKLLSIPKQWKKYEKNMINQADSVIVVIDEAKERLLKLGCKTPIYVVKNTIDIQYKNIPKINTNTKIRLVYAGGITYHRGLQYIIEGCALLKKQNIDFQLDLIGNGSYLPEIKKLVVENNLNDFIHFHGYLSYKKMMEKIEKSSIGLIPHIKSAHTDTTIPNKLFQYGFLKKGVISTNCNPLERIITQENMGLIYTYNQPKEFAKCVVQYLDENLLLQHAENGQKSVIDKYHWQNEEAELLKVYN